MIAISDSALTDTTIRWHEVFRDNEASPRHAGLPGVDLGVERAFFILLAWGDFGLQEIKNCPVPLTYWIDSPRFPFPPEGSIAWPFGFYSLWKRRPDGIPQDPSDPVAVWMAFRSQCDRAEYAAAYDAFSGYVAERWRRVVLKMKKCAQIPSHVVDDLVQDGVVAICAEIRLWHERCPVEDFHSAVHRLLNKARSAIARAGGSAHKRWERDRRKTDERKAVGYDDYLRSLDERPPVPSNWRAMTKQEWRERWKSRPPLERKQMADCAGPDDDDYDNGGPEDRKCPGTPSGPDRCISDHGDFLELVTKYPSAFVEMCQWRVARLNQEEIAAKLGLRNRDNVRKGLNFVYREEVLARWPWALRPRPDRQSVKDRRRFKCTKQHPVVSHFIEGLEQMFAAYLCGAAYLRPKWVLDRGDPDPLLISPLSRERWFVAGSHTAPALEESRPAPRSRRGRKSLLQTSIIPWTRLEKEGETFGTFSSQHAIERQAVARLPAGSRRAAVGAQLYAEDRLASEG